MHNFLDTGTSVTFRDTEGGYLVGEVLCARTGIQVYDRRELGLEGSGPINVYRPPEVVFSRDSLKTFVGKPVTMGHPREPVTSQNWKDLAIGQIGEEVVRDGEAVRVSIALMDAASIRDVRSGIQEVSMGYSTPIELRDGVAPDGTPYQAVQTGPVNINHLAIVPKARGGESLSIRLDEEWIMPIQDYKSSQPRNKNGELTSGKSGRGAVGGGASGGGGDAGNGEGGGGGSEGGSSSSGGTARVKGPSGFYTPPGKENDKGARVNVEKPSFTIKQVNSMFSENHGVGSGDRALRLTSKEDLQTVSREFTVTNPFTAHAVRSARKELKRRGETPQIINDELEKEDMNRIVVDGFTLEVNDQAREAITKLQGQLSDALKDLEERDKELAEKDAELEKKEKGMKDAQSAIPTGSVLDGLVAERQAIVDAARSVNSELKLDGLSNDDIKKSVVRDSLGAQVVDAKLTGKSEAYVSAYYDANFDNLVADSDSTQRFAQNLGDRRTSFADAAKVEDEAFEKTLKRFERKRA